MESAPTTSPSAPLTPLLRGEAIINASQRKLYQAPMTTPYLRSLAKHKRVRAISITLDLGGRKSPIRKINLTATKSETQCAEGHRGFLKGEWRNDSGFNLPNRSALLPNHQPSPP